LAKNPKNPRKISPEKLEMLKKSIARFGCLDGVIYNRTLERLVGGHQRQDIDEGGTVHVTQTYDPPTAEGTVAEGYCHIKGVRFPYREVVWDEATDKAANIAANKGAGQWDYLQLKEWMLELDDLNFDMDLTMFDEEERENLIVPVERVPPAGDADHVPGAPKEATTKRGDLYRLGDHFLLCGDATMIDDVERLMQGEVAHLVLTDPPYNVAVNDESEESLRARNRRSDGLKIANDNMSQEDFEQFLLTVFTNYFTILGDGAPIYIFYADSMTIPFMSNFLKAGFHFAQNCIWAKQQFVMTRKDYHYQHEPVLYGWKEGKAHPWHTDRKQASVWNFNRPFRNEIHPTMKPIDLLEYPLRNSTLPGQIVVDLFGGSGSTLIACEKTTRRCFMMELSPAYCDVILRRWSEYVGRNPVMLRQDGTEEEVSFK
jgi:DNA modification methylase